MSVDINPNHVPFNLAFKVGGGGLSFRRDKVFLIPIFIIEQLNLSSVPFFIQCRYIAFVAGAYTRGDNLGHCFSPNSFVFG